MKNKTFFTISSHLILVYAYLFLSFTDAQEMMPKVKELKNKITNAKERLKTIPYRLIIKDETITDNPQDTIQISNITTEFIPPNKMRIINQSPSLTAPFIGSGGDSVTEIIAIGETVFINRGGKWAEAKEKKPQVEKTDMPEIIEYFPANIQFHFLGVETLNGKKSRVYEMKWKEKADDQQNAKQIEVRNRVWMSENDQLLFKITVDSYQENKIFSRHIEIYEYGNIKIEAPKIN